MLFIPYTVGDKFELLEDCGSIGYIKCSKCGKMANFMLKSGTLQNHVDGVIPLGRKRKTFIIECSECEGKFVPHEDKIDYFIKLTEELPADIDYDDLERDVANAFENKTDFYLTPEQALENFPKLCV